LVTSFIWAHDLIAVLAPYLARADFSGGILGSEHFAPFEDYPVALWEKALRVDLTG
jgi:hypothetical protein